MIARLLLVGCWALAAPTPQGPGVIEGTVVNATRGQSPVAGAEVVLRAWVDGQFVPVAETRSDPSGRYRFDNLPVGPENRYLPGANWEGVHHPGPRQDLTSRQPRATVQLSVYDSVAEPSPLVIRRHDVLLRTEPGALYVTEEMLIDNPTNACYVGQAATEGAEPVTLQLAIPPGFERTTFQKEFFGRRFSLAEGKLVTSLPWPPGQRELKFTYVLPIDRKHYRWERPMDLPCSQVSVRVRTDRPEEVACNLPRGPEGTGGELRFESAHALPAGHTVRVDLGCLPIAWMTYARWLAAVALVLGITAMSLMGVLGSRRGRKPTSPASSSSVPSPGARHAARRRRKRGSSFRRAA